jgi:hypothetical protein
MFILQIDKHIYETCKDLFFHVKSRHALIELLSPLEHTDCSQVIFSILCLVLDICIVAKMIWLLFRYFVDMFKCLRCFSRGTS